MMRPLRRSRGIACWATKNGPLRFTATSSSKTASVVVSTVPSRPMPALLTRMSNPVPPCRVVSSASRAAKNRWMPATVPTSPCKANAWPPAVMIWRTTSPAAAAFFWKLTTAKAPSLANRRAMARPMPRLAPVMTAIFPFRLMAYPPSCLVF